VGINEQFRSLRLTVAGLGLMGGSFVKALRPLGLPALYGIDSNPQVLDAVMRAKLADRASDSPESLLGQTDLLVLCLPPAAAAELMERYQHLLPAGAVVTDVCGVKAPMLRRLQPVLRRDISYVPGHPMCGREVGGFAKSHHELYLGCNYILTPVEGSEKGAALVEELARSVGAMNIIYTSPDEHDEMIALTSHLPHAVASALIACTEGVDHIGGFMGGSFRDATRVAAMNAEMWTELFLSNRTALLDRIDCFTQALAGIRQALERGDAAALKSVLAQSSRIKERYL